MEDAKIQSNVNSEGGSLYQQGRFPSVITTDDLIFELGKETVDKINKEKLLNSLLKKSKAAEEQLEQFKAIPQKLKDLQLSNKLYEEKNRSLGDELTKVRQELMDITKQLTELNKEKEELEQKNKELLDEIELVKSSSKKNVKSKKTKTKPREVPTNKIKEWKHY